KELQNEELENFWFEFNRGDSATVALNEVTMLRHFQVESRKFGSTEDVMSEGIVEDDYKVSSEFLVSARDSTEFRKALNESITSMFEKGDSKADELSTEEKIEQL